MGVLAMLYGTERTVRSTSSIKPHERTSEHDPASEPSALFNLASLGAFCVACGLAGYLLATRSGWPTWMTASSALTVGVLAFALQSLLIARWAIPGARADRVDQVFLLQGTLARITEAVPENGTGALVYVLDDGEFALPARHMDNTPAIPAGTEVVIDRVQDGIAHVELWSTVEKRL